MRALAETEIFISQESQEQEFMKTQAKSSVLVNSSNIRKSPGPQRETTGPRTWSLGCTSPVDAAQDMNHGSRTVTSCYETAAYFPAPSALDLAAVPATEAASCG